MTKQDKVLEYISSLAESNEIQNGKFIPSENSLMIRLGFSRNTVRNALKKMVEGSVLIPVQGKGYVYNASHSPSLRSFREEYGDNSSTIFLKRRYVEEWEPTIKEYGYWEIIKVRYLDNNPFIIAYQRLSDYTMDKIDDYEESLYGAIIKSGFKIAYAKKKVEFIDTPKEARMLNPSLSDKSILLKSSTYDVFNRVIEVSLNYYKPETFNWEWIEKKF